MGHARLSPSKSKRYMLCPGSVAREEAMPKGKEVESPAAREGTRAHQLLETCLSPFNMRRPKDVPELTDVVGTWKPDMEMVNYIQETIDYIGAQQSAFLPSPSTVQTELKVDPEFVTKCPEQTGTADIIIFSKHKGVLEIADLKYGRGLRVDPEDNPQLVLYAAGVIAEMAVQDLEGIEKVVCTIMQPRIPTERGTNRSVSYPLEGILDKARMIGQAGLLALSGKGPIVPGDEQCRWCGARAECAERREWALQSSGVVFGPVDEKSPEDLRDELIGAADADPASLTDEALSSILDGIPAIEAYCRDMKVEARARLERGRQLPGYKLVAGKRTRKWLQDETKIHAALKGLRMRVKDFEKHSLLGVAKIRAILPEAKRTEFDELWHWQGGSNTVAHETDERPAVNMEAVTFGDTTEDKPVSFGP